MRRYKLGVILGATAALISAVSCFYFIEADLRPDRGENDPVVRLLVVTVLSCGGRLAQALSGTVLGSIGFFPLFVFCVVVVNTWCWLLIGALVDRLGPARDAPNRIRGAIRRLVPSGRAVLNGWVFIVEALERMALGALGSWGAFLLAYRLSPDARLVLSDVAPKLSDIALPVGLFLLSAELSLIALAACFFAGAVSRLFYLTRFVYRVAGPAGNALILGAPTLCVNGLIINWLFSPVSALSSCLLGVITTACLFAYCFEYTEALFPEVGRKGARRASCDETSSEEGGADDRHSEAGPRCEETCADSKEEERRHALTLGLKGKVTFGAIRERYLELVRQYHPDRVQHLGAKLRETAEREMREINSAYDYFERKNEGRRNS